MENGNDERFARTIMVDSKLEITDPSFTDILMCEVRKEYDRHEYRKQVRFSILVFIGIEFIVLLLIWILLIYYPGYLSFAKIMDHIMPVIQKTGYIVINNAYLFLSFVVAYITHWALNLRSRRPVIS